MTLHGGIITRRPLCYTADGRLVAAPCGADIRVYSAKSGEHIATLRGHSAEVTAVAQDASNSRLLLSASYDGTLKQWDMQEGTVEHSWHVGCPVESMVFSKAAGVAYVSLRHKGGQSGRVVPYLLPSGQEGPGKIKTSSAGQLVISPSGRYVAVIDRHSCFVWAAGASSTGARAKPLNLPHTKPYTCAAFAANDSTIALGDASGRIIVWHNFTKALDQWASSAATAAAAAAGGGGGRSSRSSGAAASQLPPCTTVHWHASAVGALCFSLDGSYLLSGGQEGVLVVWSLPSMSRNYLPRLGGPLRGIAASTADPARFCVSQTDNTVRLINTATLRVEASIHGLRPPPPPAALAAAGYGSCCSAAASSPAGVVVQPLTGHVVLPAEHATLQFFDMHRDRHIARLQVCARNPVVTAPTSQAVAQAAAVGLSVPAALVPSVVLVAFTTDSSSLVTVDVRPSTLTGLDGTSTEATLRFWDAVTSSQVAGATAPYTLNTTADNPHSGSITGLACHPLLPLAVTTGTEGEFRLWSRMAARKSGAAAAAAGAGVSHWRCAAVGGYKGLPLQCCSFSPDGSVLAVGAGATATLWDHHDNTLIASLVPPPELACSGHQLRQLLFLRNSPHLVGVLGGGDPAAAVQALGLSAPGQQQQQQQQGAQAGKRQPQQQQPADIAAASWGQGLVVWHLLTGAVSWFTNLPVCSIAADPAHAVFAVGVPAVFSSGSSATAGAAAGGQQQQQQQQAQQQGLVLVFSGHKPDPLYACPVPASSPTSLLFAQQPKSVAAGSAGCADAGEQQVSPVTLLTQDRRYTRLALKGSSPSAAAAAGQQSGPTGQADDVPSGTRAAMAAELAAGSNEGALEAMFGKTEAPAAAAAAAAGGGAAAAAAEAAAVKAAVSQLFDAPSHVLPAPSSLCPTLLELLIGAGRRPS